MSVLILGGGGFLGRHITPAIRTSGTGVITLGRSSAVDVVCDATETDQLASHLREIRPTTVVNLLGTGLSDSSANLAAMETVNARFPAILAALMTSAAPGAHLIHAASSTEAPDASGVFESDYSRSKALGTEYLWDSRAELPITILRVHNTYGPDQPGRRFVASTIDSLASGRGVSLRHPERVRDFIHVDDVAHAFLAAVDLPASDRVIYDVGTGVGTSLKSVVHTVAEIVGVEPPFVASHLPDDRHPRCVAPRGSQLVPATIDLRHGLETTITQRLKEREH